MRLRELTFEAPQTMGMDPVAQAQTTCLLYTSDAADE